MHTIAIGNGVSSIFGTPSILKYVELQITEQENNEIYSNGFQLKSIASGDSGGPIVSVNTGALVGIISNARPGVQCFTRVAAYLNWIKYMTGISTCVDEGLFTYSF